MMPQKRLKTATQSTRILSGITCKLVGFELFWAVESADDFLLLRRLLCLVDFVGSGKSAPEQVWDHL